METPRESGGLQRKYGGLQRESRGIQREFKPRQKYCLKHCVALLEVYFLQIICNYIL